MPSAFAAKSHVADITLPRQGTARYLSPVPPRNLAGQVAEALELPERAVAATLRLLAEGNTVPFIARYRKEATGALDEVQVRAVESQGRSLGELEDRRSTILASIESQGKLTDALAAKIRNAKSRQTLEDLYLPYRPKRRTRASIARDRGLEPLAERIAAQPKDGHPEQEAARFVGPDVESAGAALAGARDIVAETLTENFQLRAVARRRLFEHGRLLTKAASKAVAAAPSKFEDYFDFESRLGQLPSHRYLAICRGEAEKALRVTVTTDEAAIRADAERTLGLSSRSPWADQLRQAIKDGIARLLLPSLVSELRAALKTRADEAAVDVFAENLGHLLMAAPFGARPVVGLDPGIRTGHKLAAIDATGRLIGHAVVYNRKASDESKATEDFLKFVKKHEPHAIAVGNGTGGRDAERFAKAALKRAGLVDTLVISVNEAGASVYSASDIARREFPDLDLTVRGAISIARRLQDPLAELVKIDPKSVGVGQYQHDVHQSLLQSKLQEVVESCVNRVGVELNTASPELMQHVSGIGPRLAIKIVDHRHQNGAFQRRRDLKKVAGLGPRAFEQAAGFLRITGGDDPLDGSAVHPERYALVARIAKEARLSLAQLVGDSEAVSRVSWKAYESDEVGPETLADIASELQKPGRDPRELFEAPAFADGIEHLEDVSEGMQLAGVVTNVTKFGAFVDVGVHQDGLVHVSEMADRFVRDPAEIVRVGDRVNVRVLSVDLPRRRLSLSMRA